VDVDFVGVENGLGRARARLQCTDLGEPGLARVALPGAEDDGLGHAEPRAEASQDATHGADGDRRPALALRLEAEKLTRPGGSLPAEIFRRAPKELRDPSAEGTVRFGTAVAASLVVEARDARRRVRMPRAHDRRDGDGQDVGDLGAAHPAPEQGDGVEAHRRREVLDLADDPHQKAALRPRKVA